jgi:glutaredoxin
MITIYYLQNCPHSLAALETLEKYEIDHRKIDSSNDKEEQKKRSKYSTFPQIYWGNKLIGGNNEVTNIIQTIMSNKVPPMPEGWTLREWLYFLLNILEKL